MPTSIHRKVDLCRRGEYPYLIAKLPSGWVCLAETQPLKGYSLLFSDPVAKDMNALGLEARAQWGLDCAKVGDALIKVLGAVRVNYETWGNQDPALHTHITPRFSDEPEGRRTLPPREAYDWPRAMPTDLTSTETQTLISSLRKELLG